MRRGQLHMTLEAESIAILVGFYGAGISLRVPETTANASHIEILIGMEQCSRLVEEFGGSSVYLPGLPHRKGLGGKDLPPSLREVARLSRHLTAEQIARRFGCSARTIYNKRARLKEKNGG